MTTDTTIALPWPPSALSPNTRLHFFALARAKKSYRRACWAATLAARVAPVPDGDLRLAWTFHPPDRRTYDVDNLVARMKAGLDGVADALQFDDKRIRELGQPVISEVLKGGLVIVEIGRATTQPE